MQYQQNQAKMSLKWQKLGENTKQQIENINVKWNEINEEDFVEFVTSIDEEESIFAWTIGVFRRTNPDGTASIYGAMLYTPAFDNYYVLAKKYLFKIPVLYCKICAESFSDEESFTQHWTNGDHTDQLELEMLQRAKHNLNSTITNDP